MATIKNNYRFLTLLLIAIFIGDKLSYLNLSFFWDEAWVYGNAVSQFINSNIPLLPEPSSIDLTRGHPMLFHILTSAWGKVFGDSLMVLHCFPLVICLCFFLFLMKQKSVFSSAHIFTIILLLVGNEIFFVQSSLLLPEVMLGVFLFVAFYAAIREKWAGYVVSFTLALYTKESAIVLLPVIIALLIYNRFSLGNNYKLGKRGLFVILPIALASLHFVYQKSIFDWYFFPLHIDYIEFDFKEIASKFSRYYRAVFDARIQYFFNATFVIYVCLILYFQNAQRKIYLISSIVFSFLFLVTFNGWHNSVFVTGSMLFLTIGIGLYTIKYDSEVHRKLILGSWVFMYGFILFSAMNFYSTRYMIPVIIFYAFVYTLILHKMVALKTRALYKYLIVLFVVLIAGRFHKEELSDIDTSYRYAVKTHTEIADYFVENVSRDKTIGADFLERHFLTNANCSYLNDDETYMNVFDLYTKEQDYYIVTNLGGSLEEKRNTIDLSAYDLLASFNNSLSKGEIYKKR